MKRNSQRSGSCDTTTGMARKRRKTGPKGGRPPLPAQERKDVARSFRLKPAEDRLIRQAARAAAMPLTRWIREAVLRAARGVLKRRKEG